MIMANSTNSSSSNANGGESLLLTGDNNNSMKKEIKQEQHQSQTPTPTPQTTTSISQTTNAISVEIKAEITTTATTTTTTTTTTASSATLNKPVPQPTHLSNSDNRWIFALDKIEQSPSRVEGVARDTELLQRQEAALFINDLGTKLKVNQLCINTAIIYMHRFFMIHSLKKFHHYVRIVATSCLFFACKVEEQPRRLREFIDIVQSLFHKSNEPINHNSEEYRHYGEQIMALESCLIQTLGFNVLINHAHTVIIKTCQMIKAPRDLAEAAYLTATNSLILTDFCVKFSSEKVACFCIYLACKWTGLIIPMSSEGMQWYEYVNHDIKEQELEDISKEYLAIYGKCSNKIKKKLGITKNQDEVNLNLQSKQQGPPQHRKPNPNPSHPQQQPQQRQNNPNQVAPPSNVNKQQQQQQQQQKPTGGHPQPNGFHPQQQQTNAYHYVNAQRQQQQQQQQQQHYQQQQHRSNSNPKQVNPVQPGPPNLNKPPSTNHPQQSQAKNPNPNINSTSNRYSYPNGPTSASSSSSSSSTSSSHTHTSQQGINSQPGAASSSVSSNPLKSNQNTHVNHFNQSNSSNGQQQHQQALKKEPTNHSYKQTNGSSNTNITSNSNNSNNLSLLNTSRSSPVNTSMKRGNEEISSNVSSAPNKIPKYVIDQKSAS